MLKLQNVGAQFDVRNGTCQSFPEPLQIDEACENSDESSRRLSKEFFKVQTNYAITIVFLHCLGVRLFFTHLLHC